MKFISRLATILLAPTLIGCSQEKITKECQNTLYTGTMVTIQQSGKTFFGNLMLDDISHIVLNYNGKPVILQRYGTISWKNNRNNSCEKSL